MLLMFWTGLGMGRKRIGFGGGRGEVLGVEGEERMRRLFPGGS